MVEAQLFQYANCNMTTQIKREASQLKHIYNIFSTQQSIELKGPSFSLSLFNLSIVAQCIAPSNNQKRYNRWQREKEQMTI